MTSSLSDHAGRLAAASIARLFDADPERCARLMPEACGLTLDLTRQRLDGPALAALIAHAEASGLADRRSALFAGAAINASEDRPALHMALRDAGRAWRAKGEPVEGLAAAQAREAAFAEAVRSGAARAADGGRYEAVLHLGVGGSDLGPRLVHEALDRRDGPITLRFAANIDPADLAAATHGLDPARTLVTLVSKSFSTLETRRNYEAAGAWFGDAERLRAQTAVATASPDKAAQAGFSPEQMFGFPVWVGGRYSVWSSVGLSLQIALGPDIIAAFRAGAAAMDRHFETADWATNLPALAGLLGFWNRSILGFATRAVVPYATRLRLLPAFLQQLEMESNGKGAGPDGAPVAVSAPVTWGAEGTNGQHAFFQQLHQGPQPVPVEFVLPAAPTDGDAARHRELLANGLAQAEALLLGRPAAFFEAAGDSPTLAAQRACPGDRPSTVVLLDRLSPDRLGALLALYEHKTFVESVLWGVNAYDQWGVELGKVLAGEIIAALGAGTAPGRQAATAALVAKLARLGV